MSDILPTKNIQVYIIIAVLFGGGTLYNTTNTNVTIDKIDSMLDRIEKLEISHGVATVTGTDHEALFAHSGIFERTNQMQDTVDDLNNRILFLERLLINKNTVGG